MGNIDRVERAAPAIQPDVRANRIGQPDQRDGRRQHHHGPALPNDEVELSLVEPAVSETPPPVEGHDDESGLDIAV